MTSAFHSEASWALKLPHCFPHGRQCSAAGGSGRKKIQRRSPDEAALFGFTELRSIVTRRNSLGPKGLPSSQDCRRWRGDGSGFVEKAWCPCVRRQLWESEYRQGRNTGRGAAFACGQRIMERGCRY